MHILTEYMCVPQALDWRIFALIDMECTIVLPLLIPQVKQTIQDNAFFLFLTSSELLWLEIESLVNSYLLPNFPEAFYY